MRRPTTPPRRLRDVSDLDERVRAAVREVAPGSADAQALHALGIAAVLRLERALPPGLPLGPVLNEVLPGRLLALHRGLAGADTVAAAA